MYIAERAADEGILYNVYMGVGDLVGVVCGIRVDIFILQLYIGIVYSSLILSQ